MLNQRLAQSSLRIRPQKLALRQQPSPVHRPAAIPHAPVVSQARNLFTTDLEMVLELLRYDYGVAPSDPDA